MIVILVFVLFVSAGFSVFDWDDSGMLDLLLWAVSCVSFVTLMMK